MPQADIAVDLLNEATERHHAAGVWVGFSGGDDSLTAALVTAQAAQFRGCLHLDTGIGIPETQDFVRETCQRQGWPLRDRERAAWRYITNNEQSDHMRWHVATHQGSAKAFKAMVLVMEAEDRKWRRERRRK